MKTTLFLILASFSTLWSIEPSVMDKANSQLSIKGTSTLHDWVSVVEKFDATANITDNSVNDVSFEAIVKSIKSGKSGMDSNIYDALDASGNPKIIFTSSELKISGNKLSGKGKLTIKGKTNEIPVNLDVQKKDGALIVSGDLTLKMTDYGVDPPTAIFGTVKTGDEVILEMAFTVKNK